MIDRRIDPKPLAFTVYELVEAKITTRRIAWMLEGSKNVLARSQLETFRDNVGGVINDQIELSSKPQIVGSMPNKMKATVSRSTSIPKDTSTTARRKTARRKTAMMMASKMSGKENFNPTSVFDFEHTFDTRYCLRRQSISP